MMMEDILWLVFVQEQVASHDFSQRKNTMTRMVENVLEERVIYPYVHCKDE